MSHHTPLPMTTLASRPAATRTGPDGRAANPWPPARRQLLPPAWPILALVLLYPVWWALGLGTLIFPLLAVPMAWALWRRRPLLTPPGFGVWLALLVVVVASIVALDHDPAGTVPQTITQRLPGLSLRLVQYGALTVLLLYLGNLTERELPRLRLVKLLGYAFVLTVIGGLLGTYLPAWEFTSPVEMLVPRSIRNDSFVAAMVHPATAQLHDVLGYETPRAAAPWGYTNAWGNNYFILVGWFVVAWWTYARAAWQRVAVVGCLVVSVIPVVQSLNRGLWLALGVAAAYTAVRVAMSRRRVWPILALCGAALALALVLVATPLGATATSRLAHGHSNNIRMYTIGLAVQGVTESPLIGLATTRKSLGSQDSIAVGHTADCANCGNHTIGNNGQFWLELYTHGLLGAALFVAFFALPLWRSRHDRTPIGIAGSLVMLLGLLAMFYYNFTISTMAFTIMSCALLWRRSHAAAPSSPRTMRMSTSDRPGASAHRVATTPPPDPYDGSLAQGRR